MTYSNGIGDWKTSNPITPATTENRQTQGQKPAASTGSVAQADYTELSPTAGLIAQALGTSDVRASKVESLKQAISEGSYSVSSSDVAGKMIQSLLD